MHLYSPEEFNKAKNKELFSRECQYCKSIFKQKKKYILQGSGKFCNRKCFDLFRIKNGRKQLNCKKCNKVIFVHNNDINTNNFCSQSCSAKYSNINRKTGTKISKLEFWIQKQLLKKYNSLEFIFNNRSLINFELDIYIPKLKLAFELNGIFHYKPIFGKEKLDKIQNNDNKKLQICMKQNIELHIIDTSNQKYFSEKSSKKYFNIICNIINLKHDMAE